MMNRSKPNGPANSMPFPEWPKDVVRNVNEGQTYCDTDAIPEEMRTKATHEEDETDNLQRIEPITTLRRAYLDVYAEIVQIEFWIAHKEDGNLFYQVNLVRPSSIGFDR